MSREGVASESIHHHHATSHAFVSSSPVAAIACVERPYLASSCLNNVLAVAALTCVLSEALHKGSEWFGVSSWVSNALSTVPILCYLLEPCTMHPVVALMRHVAQTTVASHSSWHALCTNLMDFAQLNPPP